MPAIIGKRLTIADLRDRQQAVLVIDRRMGDADRHIAFHQFVVAQLDEPRLLALSVLSMRTALNFMRSSFLGLDFLRSRNFNDGRYNRRDGLSHGE